jgi:hypothetical protein
MKPYDQIRKLLGRSNACRTIRMMPSISRGFSRAREWNDSILQGRPNNGTKELDSLATANPLKSYFDSITNGNGVWKWEHYFDIYHRHLQKFVGKEVRVVEVGIYSGGSLGMWKAYFGAKCTIYGVDVQDACKAYEDAKTKVFIGDQSDRRFWQDFREQVRNVDVVIDDGGHLPEQQIVTLEETVPYLRAGGVYLCEDTHGTHNQFAAYVHGLTTSLNSTTLRDRGASDGVACVVDTNNLQKSIRSVHLYPFVTVIEKNSTPAEQLVSRRRGTQWQPFLKV